MNTPVRRTAAQATALMRSKEVYDRLEVLRRQTGDTRSGLIRRALDELFASLQRRHLGRRYVEGYRRFPESSFEVRAEAAAAKRLAKEPWE